MITHTDGEPYGPYGSPESNGAAQPHLAAPTQGEADPTGQQQSTAYGEPVYPYPPVHEQQQPYGQPQGDGQPQGFGQPQGDGSADGFGPVQAYGRTGGYSRLPGQGGQSGAEQYSAGYYRTEPEPYAVSQPYVLPADYGMPMAFNDPPTMSLRTVSAQDAYPPQAPARLPQQRETGEASAKPAGEETAGRHGLIMALGTLASRALGFVRSATVAAAISVGAVAGSYTIGNTIPTVIFVMLVGGALNSVFVPELVKVAKTHKDGGAAYTDRLLTLCGVALVALTLVAVFAAPWIVSVYAPSYTGAQRDLTVTFARYCLPEILFYGMFTLLGQVLNARGRFGAMMWTPVLNNVVVIAVFGLYIVMGGHAKAAGDVTSGQAMLLGVGTTLGVVVQALGMLPSLRAAQYRFRPRFDWRGAGLGRPLRAASWALLLMIATQVAFTELTALTTAADALGAKVHLDGVGNAAYSNAYQLFVVPQGVITVSLVTALLPRMSRSATEGNLTGIGEDLAGVLRTSAAMIVPATVLFAAFAGQISGLAYGYGAAARNGTGLTVISETLLAFAIGIPFLCAQYALARGFYAMGDARTPFWLTVVSSGTNVLLSYLAYLLLGPRWIVVGMASAQTVAGVISMVITGQALARRLRSLPAAPDDPEARTRVLRAALSAPMRSGLDGRRVYGLHLGLLLACLPGALVGHFVAGRIGGMFGTASTVNMFLGNAIGLAVGSLCVLLSLFVLAKPAGAASAVAPLARKLRLPYPQAPKPGGRRRRGRG
ncbi:murein biosynthesis integral membrane protein MurJ [Kitasatospora sp. NBC_01302]|uniref:murein biosynthesis integral membrane protein MurJ n=1 Tax=Kitasatospora sp. NBC_01302 TaxID=2903575 RepID=UPI002E1398CD|nr:murein biosynthesis integral membrane protein MurJ [Kitasatospora sp. NBC_01302]